MRTTFVLRSRKAKVSPINGFVHEQNWQVIIPTGLRIEPRLWDSARKRAKKGAAEEVEVNTRLSDIEGDVARIFAEMKEAGEELTAENFKARYRARLAPAVEKKKARQKSLFQRYDEYIEESSTRVKTASLQIHHTVKSHLKKLQAKTGTKIVYDRLTTQFFDGFFAYLVNQAGVNNITAWKIIKTFKAFLRYSYERGYTTNTDFTKFTMKRIPKGDKSTKVYLTQDELYKLTNFDLSANPRLDKVRDLYILQSNTGMRFGDVQALRREHIVGDEIVFITGKNRKAVRVPILPETRRILEKYDYDLPKITTQKQNEYLREVMKKAMIDMPVVVVDFKGVRREEKTVPKWELVSTHSAKRSFVTILRSRSVSIETIMKITGNCRATIESYIVNTQNDAMEELRSAMVKPSKVGQRERARYNSFWTECTCPHCGNLAEMEFQAEAGSCDWSDYRIGDPIRTDMATKKPSDNWLPSLEAWRSGNFWSNGTTRCLKCREFIIGTIRFRRHRFTECVPVDATSSPYDWGLIDVDELSESLTYSPNNR